MKFATKSAPAFLIGLLLSAETPVAAIHPWANSTTISNQAGEIVRGPRGKSQIALTFDAGGEAECFEDLITTLERAHVRSTFFITGSWAQKHRNCAAAITAHGHEVGNHTWSHLDLTKHPDAIVREEIARAEILLTQLTGQNPRPRWRAPYGARRTRSADCREPWLQIGLLDDR